MTTPRDIQKHLINIAGELEEASSWLTFGRMSVGDATARIAALADALRGIAPDVLALIPHTPSKETAK